MFLPISLQLDILCWIFHVFIHIFRVHSFSSIDFQLRSPLITITALFYLCIFIYIYFIRDVRQPLSQIRLSLSASLGAGQIIFLAGINATENMVSCISWKKLLFNTSNFSQPGSCSFFLFCRLLVSQQQLLCSIFWWPLSVGCWLKEFISTCLL